MRPLNPREIELLAQTLSHLEGARFQKVISSSEDVILELWHKGETYYLWFHDSTLRPFLTFWPQEMPFKIKKKTLPILLFMNAHLVNRKLNGVIYQKEQGRVLVLNFGDEFEVEFRIFPHGQNVIARAEVDGRLKKISLHKVSALQNLKAPPDAGLDARSVFDFSQEWKGVRNPFVIKVKSPALKEDTRSKEDGQKLKSLKKMDLAIQKVSEELERKGSALWRQTGDHLKSAGTLEDLPLEFTPYVEHKRSLSWNINHCFEQAKETLRKMKGTEERLSELKKKRKKMETSEGAFEDDSKAKGQGPKLKEKISNLRSFQISQDARALCGKSAKENLDLLRQANSWDLWIHLKDVPSSHGIIFKPKGRVISDLELHLVIQWFFKQTWGQKWKERIGEKFDVVVAECRYVKPLKGDRIGRVHYQKEKVMRVLVKGT